jgi:hypothetical protein
MIKQLKEWKDRHGIKLFPMRNRTSGGASGLSGQVTSYVPYSGLSPDPRIYVTTT